MQSGKKAQGDVEDETKSCVVGEVPCRSRRAAGGCVGVDARQAGIAVAQHCTDHSHRSRHEARAGLSQQRVSACKIARGDTQGGS